MSLLLINYCSIIMFQLLVFVYGATNQLSYSSPCAVTAGVVESLCEWAVESCERLSQVWWRVCADVPPGPGGDQQQRALRALMLGAAARAQHALAPLTSPHTTPTALSSAATALPPSEKDPRVVAMMQQYTDMLVNMVQQKMAQAQPTPPGPT